MNSPAILQSPIWGFLCVALGYIPGNRNWYTTDNTIMLKHLEKHRILVSIIITAVTLSSLIFWPVYSRIISKVIFLTSISMAIAFLVRNHWQAYLQAECTREKMTRNISLDLIGLAVTMAAAIYAGGQAGGWAGMRIGLWAGLAAGFFAGFLAAWAMRSLWGRVTVRK